MLLPIFMLMYGPMSLPRNTPEPSPSNSVSPVTVRPQEKGAAPDARLNMKASDADAEMVGIWPASAYRNRADGRVRLSCLIDSHGLAERCEVVSESPKGSGFGKAALEMRPVIKLAPPMGPDGPVSGIKTIAIDFTAPDSQFDLARFAQWQAGPGSRPLAGTDLKDFMAGDRTSIPMRRVTMLDNPVWVEAAGFEDLARAYPAKAGGVEGYAVDHCQVLATGALTACQTIMEEPQGRDFGKAALSLAAKFKVSPQIVARAPNRDQLWVDIPVRFPTPTELAERTVTAPSWTQVFDVKSAPKLFPPEAVASGLTTGRGLARCVVGADGAMTGCVPEQGDPDGQGFSEAAAKLAATMKMNLWSADGVPVTGGVVHIPVRLNLKGG